MMKLTLIALAMMSASYPEHTLSWNDDGQVEIMLTFAPEDVMDPFDEGGDLLDDAAKAACEGKGKADMVSDVRVRGIAVSPDGERLITLSATYACR